MTSRPGNVYEKRFLAYVERFFTGDPSDDRAIDLKTGHSLRVCRHAVSIANKLALSDEILSRVKLAGLFHDVGRFRQYTQYRTFRDSVSADHAELSVAEIDRFNLLAGVDAEAIRPVREAILWHNRYALPYGADPDAILLARILRDADKIDIFKVFSDHYEAARNGPDPAVELHLPDDPAVSDPVLAAIENNSAVRMEHLRTLNDFKLLKLGWVFDLNFQPTREILWELGYFDRIAATLPRDERILAAVWKARRYLTSRTI